MIVLISCGLALRKKRVISLDLDPQELRNVSAITISYITKDSAKSSESAAMANRNQNHGCYDGAKEIPTAESAELADNQSRQGKFIADDLRKNCGFNTISVLTFAGNEKKIMANSYM